VPGEQDLGDAAGDDAAAVQLGPAQPGPVQFDTSVAHIARVYDYWLGGCSP
jgi:hypothetical protein